MKSPAKKIDLRKNYPLFFELGLIGALLITIAAFKFHLPANVYNSSGNEIETEPPITLPPITLQQKTTPPPVLARIPAEILNDDPIDPPAIEFADFDDVGPAIDLPPEAGKNEEPEILDQAEFMAEMKGDWKHFTVI